MNFWSRRVLTAVGGLLVGLTLAQPATGNFAFVASGERIDALLYSDVTSAALAAIVAVLVSIRVRRSSIAALTVCLGAAVLVVPMASSFPGLYPNGFGAGLVLGGLLVLAASDDRAWMQSALATGVVVGSLSPVESIPRRYADYLPEGSTASDYAGWFLLAATVVAVLVTWKFYGFGALDAVERSSKTVFMGVGIPLVALLTHWWFARTMWLPSQSSAWVVGCILVAAVIAAALLSPRTTGLVLLAGLAACVVDAGPYIAESRWVLLVSVAAAVVGMVLGRRWPVPVVGFGLLGLLAVPTVFFIETDPIVLMPGLLAYLFASSLPSDGARVAIGVVGPMLFYVPFASDFGWTAYSTLEYTPLTSEMTSSSPMYDAQALGATATILLCGAVAWMLSRRERTIESP